MKKIFFALLLIQFFTINCTHKRILTDLQQGLNNADLKSSCQGGDQLACLLNNENPRIQESSRLPVLQGVAPQDQVVFSITRETSTPLRVFYREAKSLNLLEISPSSSEQRFGVHVETFLAQGLNPEIEYQLILTKKNGDLLDYRSFKSLSQAGSRLRFAITSCMDDRFAKEQGPIWADLLSKNIELLLMIGDNVYADSQIGKTETLTPDQAWKRYVETRRLLGVFRASALVPIAATWDDHDYGQGDGDRTYPHKSELMRIFQIFFPFVSNGSDVMAGAGVGKALKLRQQVFILTDNRSFRSPNRVPQVCASRTDSQHCKDRTQPNPIPSDETHFGIEQEAWILRLLGKERAATWLISGDQWFGGYQPFESYQGNHPDSFRDFLQRIAQARRSSPVIFVSGDRHLSELMRIKHPRLGQSFELTSSAIHAKVYPPGWDKFPNTNQIQGRGQTLNYTIVESDANKNQLRFKVLAFGPNNQVLYQEDLKLPF